MERKSIMKKLTAFIEENLLPFAVKISNNIYLKAITRGFSELLPVLIIGALFTLIGSFNIPAYQQFVTSTGLKTIFMIIPAVSTNMFAVYTSFSVARALADEKGYTKESVTIGILTILVFLLMIPVVTMKSDSGASSLVLPTTFLGAPGLFSAMILGLIVPSIYGIFISRNIGIKMPQSVPPMISRSFSAIVPAFFIGFLFAVVRFLFSITKYGDFNSFIYGLLKSPLMKLGASPMTFFVLIFLSSTLWFFGIHGGMVVGPFITILYAQSGLENLAAFAAGTALPNIISPSVWLTYASLGGVGGSIGLALCLAFIAKSKRYRTLGKLSLPGVLCSINEPITFGLPYVLNTITLIPMILVPIATFGLSYALTVAGILPRLNGMAIPLGTPVIMSGFLSGGWKVALWQIALIGVQFIIYLPFFKVLDAEALKMESDEIEEEADATV